MFRLALITLATLLTTVACAPSTNNGQSRERRSNLAHLIAAGCVFTFDEHENTPRTATFSDGRATDELLVRLSALGSLEEINLDASPQVSDVGVKALARLPRLRVLNAATPIIDGSQVLISESYGPGAALLEWTGAGLMAIWSDSPRQRRKTLQCHWCTPILHEGYIYGCSGRRASDAELRCIEWSTGRVMWSEPCQSRCSLLYVDEHIIVQSEHGEVSLIEATPEHYRPVGLLNVAGGPGEWFGAPPGRLRRLQVSDFTSAETGSWLALSLRTSESSGSLAPSTARRQHEQYVLRQLLALASSLLASSIRRSAGNRLAHHKTPNTNHKRKHE